jgi:hypothetical protein
LHYAPPLYVECVTGLHAVYTTPIGGCIRWVRGPRCRDRIFTRIYSDVSIWIFALVCIFRMRSSGDRGARVAISQTQATLRNWCSRVFNLFVSPGHFVGESIHGRRFNAGRVLNCLRGDNSDSDRVLVFR